MSAMQDFHSIPPMQQTPRAEFRTVRDVLLSACIVLLSVLSLQSTDKANNHDSAPNVGVETEAIDWKGNSGGPLRGPY